MTPDTLLAPATTESLIELKCRLLAWNPQEPDAAGVRGLRRGGGHPHVKSPGTLAPAQSRSTAA